MPNLESIGWNTRLQERMPLEWVGTLGRVAAEHTHVYAVWTGESELLAEVPGALRHQARSREDFPAVGDWVIVELKAGASHAVIRQILPRYSKLSRRVKDRSRRENSEEEQLLATNVDVLFIASALDRPPDRQMLERLLVMASNSGTQPVVLLTKSDSLAEWMLVRDQVLELAPDVTVLAVSAITGDGLETLTDFVGPGRTLAIIGPSGAGKSTLVNRLIGKDMLRVGEVRATDQKGRHTTTHRQMVQIPGGGVIIDTPGLRELKLWEADAGLENTFGDIQEMAGECRFRDCDHQTAPGCAVQAAFERGDLAKDRLDRFLKLNAEVSRKNPEPWRKKGPGRPHRRR
jgi:ribosome biogenesis GTPase